MATKEFSGSMTTTMIDDIAKRPEGQLTVVSHSPTGVLLLQNVTRLIFGRHPHRDDSIGVLLDAVQNSPLVGRPYIRLPLAQSDSETTCIFASPLPADPLRIAIVYDESRLTLQWQASHEAHRISSILRGIVDTDMLSKGDSMWGREAAPLSA